MEQSLFHQYVAAWFKGIISGIVEKINGSKEQPKYLFKTMLKKLYSPTLKWQSLSSNGNIVAADVVAMDTELPLKKRDAIKIADGDIPKLGMKKYLGEKDLTNIDILVSQNRDNSRLNQILAALFGDSKKVISGVYEQLERMFLEALSTGVTVIVDDEKPGIGVRIDYGHPDKNKFGVTAKWSGTSASPIDDIENVIEKASEAGDIISYLMMDRSAFNNMRKHADVKALFAGNMGISAASGSSNIPNPTLEQLNAVLDQNYDIQIVIVNRSVMIEANGKRNSIKPWAKNTVVFLTTMELGDLTWGRLAEMNHPAKNVDYEIADDYILVSKYHKTDPLKEFTSSQALVLPVINGIESIYIMDSEEATAAEDTQTEGDANFTYQGTSYTKASVVEGLNETKEVAESTVDQKDSTLANKIDKLSKEGVAIFESKLVESA